MTAKALAAWQELNDRQQGTLGSIYALDQEAERGRKLDAAGGHFDRRPAAVWRRIDFAHDPSDRRLFGTTDLQDRLAGRGWDNQGNGSTMAALAERGLIKSGGYRTTLGWMRTVTLTPAGRAAARAGTSLTPGTVPQAALGRRAWEVLATLWIRDQAGKSLDWGTSTTIDRVLIGKHNPPLAQKLDWPLRGYAITDTGRAFYREHHTAHTAAHPDVHAPHPDGAAAEPWPPAADEILTRHERYYGALCRAWRAARDAQQAAEKERAAEPPAPDPLLPADVTELVTVRQDVWCDTARQRAEIAAAHATDLHHRSLRAARGYAAAALSAFHAAAAGRDPLPDLTAPEETVDEPRLDPPAETGIPAIDTEATTRHADAVGAPQPRRGPAPKPRRTRTLAATTDPAPGPGEAFAQLADFLVEHVRDGALLRRLHPDGTVTT